MTDPGAAVGVITCPEGRVICPEDGMGDAAVRGGILPAKTVDVTEVATSVPRKNRPRKNLDTMQFIFDNCGLYLSRHNSDSVKLLKARIRQG
jgi:hypothetical protein